MSSPQLPTTAIPLPLAEDDDDVSWALQTAAVQWGRGAYQDALVWLRRAAESAIELNAWSRGADLNAAATRLEKLVSQANTASQSVRPAQGTSSRPAFPKPSAGGSQVPGSRRSSTGISSLPPRNSVVIDDIEETELDLSDEEIRELEADSPSAPIPDGYRPSTHLKAGSSSGSVSSRAAEPLPSFGLEPPSRPSYEAPRSSPSALPSFSLEPSTRPPPKAGGLPRFPVEQTGTGSLPPVSQWPSRRPEAVGLPGSPGQAAAGSSRPFVNDGDDGATGLGEGSMRPVAPAPPLSSPEVVLDDEIEEVVDAEELGVVELAPSFAPSPEVKSKPPSVSRIPIRPGAASTRPKAASSLPPARPTRGSEQPGTAASLPPRTIEPRMPSRLPLEPRMPERRPTSNPADSRPSSPVAAPVEPLTLGAASIPPSWPTSERPRSIEPDDLPTVTSPSVQPVPVTIGQEGIRRAPPPKPSASTGIPSGGGTPEPAVVAPISNRRPAPSVPARRPQSLAPAPVPVAATADESPVALPEVVEKPSVAPPSSVPASLMGVRLADVRGFADLPALALDELVKNATIEHLNQGEEVSSFAVALVLEGWVSLMPAISDAACATAVVGEVVFSEGTLEDGLMLRVVAGQDRVVVATWDSRAIVEATKDCPWLADDLRLLADGFQALAGACLGPLGDRLDDSLRSLVTSRCEIRTLLPGEVLCSAKKPVPGMHIIGGGTIELIDDGGQVTKAHGTGEFLFSAQVLGGGVAPQTARAGSHGALVLFAPRMAAHELLVSVPPLLEILAD